MTNLYNVLVRPLVTEKSNYQSRQTEPVCFCCSLDDATRTVVKDAVETLFDVTVARVNIINAPAKRGRRTRARRCWFAARFQEGDRYPCRGKQTPRDL
jgi:large subunit ribosomal protein L23